MPQTLDVVFVLYDNLLSTSLSLPMELLRAAEASARARQRHGYLQVRIRCASLDGGPVVSHSGMNISPDSAALADVKPTDQQPPTQAAHNPAATLRIQDIQRADIIFLPALWRNPFPIVRKNETICSWLSEMFSRETTRIAGVGTGCFFLAEAGLLDGRVATTHWHFFDRFADRYPEVKLKTQYFITQSGRLYCTGSVNTLADLTLHFIRQSFGAEISTEVERHFFHDIRQNYDKLALLDDAPDLHDDELVLDTLNLIHERYDEALDFNTLATRAGLSRRHFDRRFKKAMGSTPLHYLQKTRIEAARDLLKDSNLSIAEIIEAVGYSDSAHFGKLFRQHHGTGPKQYRTTVRAKLFHAEHRH